MAAHKASLLILLVALLPEASNATAEVVSFPSAELIESCYYKNARYYSSNTTRSFTKTIYECQQQCAQNATFCEYFGWWPSTGSCFHAGKDAVYTEYLAEGGYTGPRVCPEKPNACTESPSWYFPGPDEDTSKLAWPSHRVPNKLECWPKDYIGKTYLSCPSVKVLEDTETGWPGRCFGLNEVVVPLGETCQSSCSNKVSCAVWQTVEQEYPIPEKCYQSYFSSGRSCYTRTLANGSDAMHWNPKQSQRIMHGEVRVLKSLTKVDMDGLYHAFDQNYFIKVEDAISACKASCYSDVGCQWWIYNQATGCWVEDINYKALPVPVTTAVYMTDTPAARGAIAGEYIQHVCAEAPISDLSSTQTIPPWTNKSESSDEGGTTTEPPSGPLLTPGEAQIVLNPTAASNNPLAKGAMGVVGVSFEAFSPELTQQLASKYAELIAAQVGVDQNKVLNEKDEAGSTGIQSWTKGTSVWRRLQATEGIGVQFQVILDTPGQAGVSEALNKLTEGSFLQTVGEQTVTILKDTPGTLTTPGVLPEVQVALREAAATSGLYPNGAPAFDMHQDTAAATTSSSGEESTPAWKWIIFIIILLLIFLCLLYLCYVYSTNPKRKAGAQKFQDSESEEDKPLFGANGADLEVPLPAPADPPPSPVVYAAAPAPAPMSYTVAPASMTYAAAPITYAAAPAAASITSIKVPSIVAPVSSTVQMAPMYQTVTSPAVQYSAPTTGAAFQSTGLAPSCPSCGNVYLPDAVFCRKCGHKRPNATSLFDQLDTDGDGVLSREEMSRFGR